MAHVVSRISQGTTHHWTTKSVCYCEGSPASLCWTRRKRAAAGLSIGRSHQTVTVTQVTSVILSVTACHQRPISPVASAPKGSREAYALCPRTPVSRSVHVGLEFALGQHRPMCMCTHTPTSIAHSRPRPPDVHGSRARAHSRPTRPTPAIALPLPAARAPSCSYCLSSRMQLQTQRGPQKRGYSVSSKHSG